MNVWRTGTRENWSPADFLDFRRQSGSFEYLAGYREENVNLTGRDRPQRINGAGVTADFFAAMKIQTQIGRAFDPRRDKPGTPLAVLSDSLWRRQYGADPNISGKTLDIDGVSRTIIGVMPASFQFPAECEIWTLSRFAVPEYPLTPTVHRSNDRGGHYFEIVARLKSGVTIEQARTENEVLAQRLKRQYGNDEEAVGAALIGLREDLVGQTRPALLLLLAAVTMLLLGCVRECGEPAAGAGCGAAEGNCGPGCIGGQPLANHTPASYREHLARLSRRRGRDFFRILGAHPAARVPTG